MTQDEQHQLDRLEAKLDRWMGELTVVRIEQAAHVASNEAHDAKRIAGELSDTRRDVVKLGAIIGGVVLVVNSVAVTIIIRAISGGP